jgi:hypothetical protein
VRAPDPNSRYFGLRPVSIARPDGSVRVLGPVRIARVRPATSNYQVQPGDRLDLLGEAATTDSTRWWVLADANPWADATRLEDVGTVIEVPDG